MSYPQLIKECAKVIEEGRCLGCNAIEPPYNGIQNCIHSKIPTAQESINKIKQNLGIGEQMKI